MSILSNDDILDYLINFINIKNKLKLCLVSKKIYNLYNIQTNPFYNIYISNDFSIDHLYIYSNYIIITKFNYKNNKKLFQNFKKHNINYSKNINNIIKFDKFIYIYNFIELFYHSTNRNYKELYNLLKNLEFKYSYNTLNIYEFNSIFDFILEFINSENKYINNYFSQYTFNTIFICKLILSLQLFIIINNNIYICNSIKLKNSYINKIKEFIIIINKINKHNYLFPIYFLEYILKMLNNYLNNVN